MASTGHILYDMGSEFALPKTLTLQKGLEYHFKHFSRPEGERLKFLILNALDTEQIDYDMSAGINIFERLQPHYKKPHKIAFVTADEERKTNFISHIEKRGNPNWTYRVFKTCEDAREWAMDEEE